MDSDAIAACIARAIGKPIMLDDGSAKVATTNRGIYGRFPSKELGMKRGRMIDEEPFLTLDNILVKFSSSVTYFCY